MITKSTSVQTVSLVKGVLERLTAITTGLGIKIENEWSRDVSFRNGVISIGHSDTLFEQEEKLGHELGHFLCAPKSRRWHKNYGHPDPANTSSRSLHYYEKEELAASVLGMVLQRWCGGKVDMSNRAYLWNDSSHADFWYPHGFWIGAGILVREGWVLDDFKLNVEKLEEAFSWDGAKQ